jgi:hypothetical protein
MVWVENVLINGVGNIADVDGHDAGSGEVNIFLLTDHPKLAFEAAKRTLGSKDFMIGLKAAIRECNEKDYQPIWPLDLTSFSVT